MPMPTPTADLIAHRGASFDAPENTLASIQLAWKQQADAVEIDVQFTKDGQLVVIHDDNTHRTAGLRKKVAAQTLAELQTLDVGRWKHPRWTGERIATLREAFAAIPAGKRLFVEIKCGPECIPRFLEDYRQSKLKPEQVVPIGFSLETMRRLKQALPELEVYWAVEFKRTLQGWSPAAKRLIEQVKAAGLQGLDVSGRGPVNASFTREVHAAGLKLYIWTVDSPALARKLRDAGVDGLTTNKPGWLREQLAGPSEHVP
ncbi:MAG TPA: glycerophosphodiester phosphodiesterase [Verrucomicrobiae bacterium]|nr:glycerophosphodiester phosphodiesterase [Verrucomicrobiae bacterium]